MKEEEINKIRRLIVLFGEQLGMENYSLRTMRDYPYQLKTFVEFLRHDDAESLAEITPDTLARYQSYLYGLKKRKTMASLSLSCQSVKLTVVRQFFRYLVDQDKVLNDPTRKLELPKLNKNLPKAVMTVREIRSILAQPNADNPIGLRDKAILELLYSTGMRNSELRYLMLYDVDTAGQEVRINQGKGRKDRVLPMGSIAAGYVEEYIQNARPALLKRVGDIPCEGWGSGKECPHLFITKSGKQITVGNLICLIAKYAEQAQITKHVTPHAFRHTCATHLLKHRASLRHIQELLGHKTIATTQIYTQLETTDLRKELHRCHPRERSLSPSSPLAGED